MTRRKKARRGALALALSGALAFALPPTSQAYEWYPGLPDATFGNWANVSQGGLAYTKRAKQWFRSTTGMVTTEFAFYNDYVDPTGNASRFRIDAETYIVSPEGAPDNYGYFAPMTVRSVGFGLMPVEATVQVSQRRRNGFPVPLKAQIRFDYDKVPRPGHPGEITTRVTSREMNIQDSFDVRVLSVRVDGEDLRLNGKCRTVEPAPFKLIGPEYVRPDDANVPEDVWYRTNDPETYYHPQYGGQLKGSITIPAFTGCTTSAGDDLSDLITLAASGPDNPLIGRSGFPECSIAVNGQPAPAPPGMATPKKANCPGPKPFQYPERDDD